MRNNKGGYVLVNKYLLDCDSFRLKKSPSVTEGGMSRNTAIKNYLLRNEQYKVIEISGNRTLSSLQAIKFFLTHKNDQIFILYPTRFFLMGGSKKINRFLGNFAVKCFVNASNRNRIIVDVSDIKYEQSIDLEIEYPDMKLVEEREKSVFSASAEFIFASESMKSFAVKKYGINENKCETCINGGMKSDMNLDLEAKRFQESLSQEYINCVYAGTLNKGRLIDKMIDCFKRLSNAKLFLMGPNGEWIQNYLNAENVNNVYYLGPKDEKTAHQMVSLCDLGLIPYDEGRLYYNIAYPTKLSFYITAGIPYLSTPVKEVIRIQNKKIGYTATIAEWSAKINGMNRTEIASIKKKIECVRNEFTWESVLKGCSLMNS